MENDRPGDIVVDNEDMPRLAVEVGKHDGGWHGSSQERCAGGEAEAASAAPWTHGRGGAVVDIDVGLRRRRMSLRRVSASE